jgi:putative tricarboxylic transport membrane protein
MPEGPRAVLRAKLGRLMPSMRDLREARMPILRGTALGSFFGVLPGGGAAIASFASYMLEKKVAKDPSRFGKGAIEGVAGPESANNAARADQAFIPMLTLGLPERGDGADARRADHPGHPARPRGDDFAARSCSGA